MSIWEQTVDVAALVIAALGLLGGSYAGGRVALRRLRLEERRSLLRGSLNTILQTAFDIHAGNTASESVGVKIMQAAEHVVLLTWTERVAWSELLRGALEPAGTTDALGNELETLVDPTSFGEGIDVYQDVLIWKLRPNLIHFFKLKWFQIRLFGTTPPLRWIPDIPIRRASEVVVY